MWFVYFVRVQVLKTKLFHELASLFRPVGLSCWLHTSCTWELYWNPFDLHVCVCVCVCVFHLFVVFIFVHSSICIFNWTWWFTTMGVVDFVHAIVDIEVLIIDMMLANEIYTMVDTEIFNLNMIVQVSSPWWLTLIGVFLSSTQWHVISHLICTKTLVYVVIRLYNNFLFILLDISHSRLICLNGN